MNIPKELSSPIILYENLSQHFGDPEKNAFSTPFDQVRKLTIHSVRNRYYTQFEIPKKSGGVRTITAPAWCLKHLQRYLADLLSSCFEPEDCVHGFVKGRSVLTNAEWHVGKYYVLNIDLKDFFPSITEQMVSNGLHACGINRQVSDIIASICTWTDSHEDDLPVDVLPQGAPTSPILSNYACIIMDMRLEHLARRFGLTYTRYADDMTFSSYHSVYAKDSEFWKELRDIISQSGFIINEAKTRLLKRGSRQEVTGITVCEKPNVSRKWLKNLRAAIYHAEMYGYRSEKEYLSVKGKLAYLKMVRGWDLLYEKLYLRALYAHSSIPLLQQHMWYPRQISWTGLSFGCPIRIGYESDSNMADSDDYEDISSYNPFE